MNNIIIKKNRIGSTQLEITELGMGTAPIGGWPIAVTPETANNTLERSWNKGIRYFDTAPLYGAGMAEERLGDFLSQKKRDDFAVATKVGRIIVPSKTGDPKFKGSPKDKEPQFDFSYDGAMRSFEMSLERLKLDRVDVLQLHDPDNHPDHLDEAKKGAIKAMMKLKDEKVVKALGCGLNQNEMLIELAKERCFDCFLLAGRYTLLDQSSLDELIPICISNNISLILGGVFNSGILIDPSPDTYFDYTKLDSNWYENAKKSLVRFPKGYESDEYWLNKAYKLRDVCDNFDISLKSAAIQFPYGNDIVATSILGMASVNEVDENVKDYNKKIPIEFWNEIKSQGLIDKRSPLGF